MKTDDKDDILILTCLSRTHFPRLVGSQWRLVSLVFSGFDFPAFWNGMLVRLYGHRHSPKSYLIQVVSLSKFASE